MHTLFFVPPFSITSVVQRFDLDPITFDLLRIYFMRFNPWTDLFLPECTPRQSKSMYSVFSIRKYKHVYDPRLIMKMEISRESDPLHNSGCEDKENL